MTTRLLASSSPLQQLMSHCKKNWALGSFLLLAVTAVPVMAQQAPPIHVGGTVITGVADDWSHHHVVFANPGTVDDALKSGSYEKWTKVVNDPRYVLQQLKRGLPVQGPAAEEVEYRYKHAHDGEWKPGPDSKPGKVSKGPTEQLEKDWSMATGASGALLINQYPAKFTFDTTSAGSCNDFVVYPTGLLGSGTQATIIAYTSIYGHTTCPSGPSNGGPNVYWAYNTGGTAALSPVISGDATGSQVAYVQVTAGAASVVLLKWSTSGGTAILPAAITSQTTATYRACGAPCYVTLPLKVGATAETDTNSAPFYVYYGTGSDTLYVGDDTGHLHQITGAFNGTPAIDTNTGWPVTLGTTKVTSPVVDPIHNLVFAGDAGGILYSVTETASPTKATSNRIAFNTAGIADAPVVDVMTATTSDVYAFVGCNAATCTGSSAVTRFPTGTTIAASSGTSVLLGSDAVGTTVYDGAFDNTHYTGTGATGYMYVCGYHTGGTIPRLFQIAMSTFTGTATTLEAAATNTAGTCGPVTEFLSAKTPTTLNGALTAAATSVPVTLATSIAVGDYVQVDSEIMHVTAIATNTLTVTRAQLGTAAATHLTLAPVSDNPDWIFVTETAGGTDTGCTGACLYNFLVGTSTASATPTAATTGIAATLGTTGIVIDNKSTAAGESQIYYSTLGNQACTGNGTTGNLPASANCAVQTLQSAP